MATPQYKLEILYSDGKKSELTWNDNDSLSDISTPEGSTHDTVNERLNLYDMLVTYSRKCKVNSIECKKI